MDAVGDMFVTQLLSDVISGDTVVLRVISSNNHPAMHQYIGHFLKLCTVHACNLCIKTFL